MEYYTSDSGESDTQCEDRSTVDVSYMEITGTSLDGIFNNVNVPTNIRTVLLYHNNISYLPDSIALFRNLRYLDISSNQLTELPDDICNCPLTTLIAKNNRLEAKSLPPSFSKLNQLRELNLNGNLFLHIPPEIFTISSLQFLYLGGNKITDIPRDIARLYK